MKILVNTRLLVQNKMDGIGWFTCESLNIMTRRNPEHEFIFVFDRQPHPSFRFGNNVQLVTVPPQARHPFLYILWFELSLPYMIRKHKPDLLLSPDGFLPVLSRIPSLAVIHDLNFEHNPEDLPWLTRNYYRCFFPHFARKATRIATVSGFSKDDITQTYGIDPAKIDVVYNGASNGFKPADPSVVLETRHFYTRGLPYFLFVGTLHPRKNLENLFLAFDHFRSCHPEPFCLLIVGNRKWWTPGIEETYRKMKFRNDVIFTGRLTPERLHLVTASAFAVTYVSFFEGFGIPLLEAMYSDVPVITSNVTSMPEVAGEAALLTDPRNPESIATAMMQLATDPELYRLLIEKGRHRRLYFSWEKTAERLWESILRTVNPPNN